MEVAVIVVVLVTVVLGMVRPSVELRSSHPLHEVVDKVNENGGPYIGLVMAYPTEEIVLVESGCFISDPYIPWLDLAGKYFLPSTSTSTTGSSAASKYHVKIPSQSHI